MFRHFVKGRSTESIVVWYVYSSKDETINPVNQIHSYLVYAVDAVSTENCEVILQNQYFTLNMFPLHYTAKRPSLSDRSFLPRNSILGKFSVPHRPAVLSALGNIPAPDVLKNYIRVSTSTFRRTESPNCHAIWTHVRLPCP